MSDLCSCCGSEAIICPTIEIKKPKFYLRNEVVVHNHPNDFWIIIAGIVLDLTKFIKISDLSIEVFLICWYTVYMIIV